MQSKNRTADRHLVGLFVAATTLTGVSGTAVADGFTEALTGGDPKVNIRLRFEDVSQNNPLMDADALTVRTRLGYQTGDFNDFSAYVEMENTTAITDDYNSGPGGNGRVAFSVIADPEQTELNQTYLDYKGISDTLVRAGRQRIIHGNARFVGNVGWRQNEQTYTGFSVTNKSLPDTEIKYSWLDEIINIFGADVDTQAHLLHATWSGFKPVSVTGYGYLIEFPDAPLASQQTWGLRLSGGTPVGDAKVLYTVEGASQSDYQDGNSAIDADYTLIELGVAVSGVTAKIGQEVLGADTAFSFETPLATKHAFNGWADVFLNTPDGTGLEDKYFSVGGKVAGTKLLAVYHDYEADSGGMDYGSELNLLAARKFGKHYSAGVKYASYDSDGFAVDTDKIWIWGGMAF